MQKSISGELQEKIKYSGDHTLYPEALRVAFTMVLLPKLQTASED